MTHSLAWKEFREVGKWSGYLCVLHLLAVITFIGLNPRHLQSLEPYDGFIDGPVWLALIPIGMLFGVLQILAEANRDRLTLITHRPMSVDAIFLTKWSIGALGLSVAYLLPLVAFVLWLNVPGVVPRPFWWPSLAIAFGHLLPILIAHAAGMFFGQHGPAWVLGRGLVVFTVYQLFFVLFAHERVLHVSWVLQQVLAALILAMVVIAAKTTYVTAGEPWTARSRFGRRALALLMVAGVSLALTMVLSLWERLYPEYHNRQNERQRTQPAQKGNHHWSISRTGLIGQWKELLRHGRSFDEWTTITGQVQLEKNLSVEEFTQEGRRPLPPVDSPDSGGSIATGWPAWPHWSWKRISVVDEKRDEHNDARVDHSGSGLHWSPPVATHQRFHEVWMSNNKKPFYLWWYHGTHVIGYHRITNQCIGYLGPQGPQTEPFLLKTTDARDGSKGFRSDDGRYWEIQAGPNSDILAPPECCPPPDTLNWDSSSLSDGVRETVAVLPDRLLRLDRHGALIEQIPLSKPLNQDQSWSVEWRRRQDGNASVILVNYADHDVAIESDGHGHLLKSIDLPLLEVSVGTPAPPPPSVVLFPQVLSGLGLAPLLWAVGGIAEVVGGVDTDDGTPIPPFNHIFIPGMALGCGVGILFVIVCACRRRLTGNITMRWVAGCLLLGIVTPLALRELHRLHRVTCPSCGRLRLVQSLLCQQCAATWSTPAKDGRELLDPMHVREGSN